MSFLSVGDIIICTQIAYRLLQSVTQGRKKAPHEIQELENVLFGLYCALEFLQRQCEANTSRATSTTRPDNTTTRTNMQLAYMVKSCLDTLRELDNATAKYRDIADPPPHTAILPVSTPLKAPLLRLRVQVHTQWKRILWDLRGASYATKYRQRIQSHTDSINLFLNTLTWSATDRIGDNVEHQTRRLEELVQQARQFNLHRTAPSSVQAPQPAVACAPNHLAIASTSSTQQATLVRSWTTRG
ncbi:hypothetical protein N7528_001607 [Penicillium herquei]|nr:hypothetical protein N7528_001607 [Penicillium herquei]